MPQDWLIAWRPLADSVGYNPDSNQPLDSLNNKMIPAMPSFTLADHAHQLGYWIIIRTFILSCLIVAVLLCVWDGTISLPLTGIITTLVIMAAINLLTYFRLRQSLAVTQLEFFIQLLIDLICLSQVFYLSGGANNPFISYFLVPICVSAATLSGQQTLIITSLSIISYSLLLYFHIPLPILSPDHHHGNHPVNFHVLGMWLNFFISACLITYFVVKMASDIRTQEEQLNQWREDELRDEQLMAVATLAAGTAHELGTPLSTMKLLLSELRQDHLNNKPLQQDLELLQQQVEQCAATLRGLVHTAEQTKDGQFPLQSIQEFCNRIIERWKVIRPDAKTNIDFQTDAPEQQHRFHPSIAQAIINLLNNAADANPENLHINIYWNSSQLEWKIEDEGPGIPDDIAQQLGKSFVASDTGLGIGLYLTHATINRYGGSVSLHKRSPTGTLTHLRLPLMSTS
jgi:two-component system, sensor histidine kinase RegB